MTTSSASTGGSRRKRPRQLDAIDRQLLCLLRANGRMSNAALAAATSMAESSTHARLQALKESGVISGVHASFDTAAIGRPLQAAIFVRIHPGMRDELEPQLQRLAHLPATTDIYFLGGHYDFVVLVAVSGQEELRQIVIDDLSSHKAIASTETSVVLQHRRGEGFAPRPDGTDA